MPDSPPMPGPEMFKAADPSIKPEQVEANALAYIAQRMAGIEWELQQLNETVHKAQASLTALAHTAAKMIP